MQPLAVTHALKNQINERIFTNPKLCTQHAYIQIFIQKITVSILFLS
jgi:hypothetical protein